MRDSGLKTTGRNPRRRADVRDYWTKDCVKSQVLLKPTAPDKAAGMFAVRVVSFDCAMNSSTPEQFYSFCFKLLFLKNVNMGAEANGERNLV